MATLSSVPNDLAEVDVIIAGGGTAGCVVAARLAEADPSLSILVFEAGPDNFQDAPVIHPALLRGNFAPDTPHSIAWQGKEEPQLGGRAVFQVTGGVLGGGSSVNGMIYARGQAVDYDSWATPGWSTRELLPYLKKLEKYRGPDPNDVHGNHGPTAVSSGLYRGVDLEKDFISAVTSLGYPEAPDIQDLKTNNAISHSRRYVSPCNGRRQDAAHTYLHPRLRDGKHQNLRVVVGSEVTRVILSPDGTATGVEYRPNPRLTNTTEPPRTLNATRLVVLSAGTMGTPLLLERSGVGDRAVLDNAGIPVARHIPGVGRDFQDHQTMEYIYHSKVPVQDTFESVYNGARNVTALVESNDPFLSWNGCDASAKLRPTDEEVRALGPGFQRVWAEKYANSPTKPLVIMIFVNGILSGAPTVPSGPSYLSIFIFTAYPESRGTLHTTGPNIDDSIEWTTGILSDEEAFDLDTQIWAYKKQREIAHRLRNLAGEIPGQHPNFPTESLRQPAANETDFEYSPEDDKAIEELIRAKVITAWHAMGTCKMAPEEALGVVDGTLGVHGLQHLKIADLSIVPQNIAGNTMHTALLVGEKAADTFIKELGL